MYVLEESQSGEWKQVDTAPTLASARFKMTLYENRVRVVRIKREYMFNNGKKLTRSRKIARECAACGRNTKAKTRKYCTVACARAAKRIRSNQSSLSPTPEKS